MKQELLNLLKIRADANAQITELTSARDALSATLDDELMDYLAQDTHLLRECKWNASNCHYDEVVGIGSGFQKIHPTISLLKEGPMSLDMKMFFTNPNIATSAAGHTGKKLTGEIKSAKYGTKLWWSYYNENEYYMGIVFEDESKMIDTTKKLNLNIQDCLRVSDIRDVNKKLHEAEGKIDLYKNRLEWLDKYVKSSE